MIIEKKQNKKFISLYKADIASNFKLSPSLERLIDEGFSIVDECIYFRSVAPKGKYSEEFVDRTGNECFHNKIQIDDYYIGKKKEDEFFVGVLFSEELLKALDNIFNQRFNVILSFDNKYCNVTFHKVRASEIWLNSDLENYKDEAILELKNKSGI